MVWYGMHVCVKLCKYLSISISGSQHAIWEINVGPTWTSEEFPKWSKLPPMVWRRKRAERIPVPVAEWWAKPWRNPWRNARPTKYGSLKYLKHLEATHIGVLWHWMNFLQKSHAHKFLMPFIKMSNLNTQSVLSNATSKECRSYERFVETIETLGTINNNDI